MNESTLLRINRTEAACAKNGEPVPKLLTKMKQKITNEQELTNAEHLAVAKCCIEMADREIQFD